MQKSSNNRMNKEIMKYESKKITLCGALDNYYFILISDHFIGLFSNLYYLKEQVRFHCGRPI